MSELKPCPFCGSKNIDESFARGFDKGDETKPVIGAGCMDCGACAPMVTFPKNTTGYKESSEAWNQRANESQLQASEWTKVEDSLPEDEPRLITTKHVSKVLVWATTTFFEAFYNHDEKIFEFKQGAPISFVTHWRSITPPTE